MKERFVIFFTDVAISDIKMQFCMQFSNTKGPM
uniref:Uncharacterized protein n=1 Tax=Anguilla anguilla TaxID=7936 RepID=A0A0E9RJF6_ANGAN